METIKYDNPEQVEIVKSEIAKLTAHDKALYTAESIQAMISDIKTSGWKAWTLKVAAVVIPLVAGALIGMYCPQLHNVLTYFIG